MGNILNFIDKICRWGAVISLWLIMIVTTMEILLRKVFNLSISGVYEFTSDYFMVGMVYLTFAYVYVIDEHIKVTLFFKYIPKRIKPVLDKLVDIASLAFFILIAVMGFETAVTAFKFNEVSNSLIPYPMGPAYLLIPIGAGLLAIRIIQSLILPKSFKKSREISKAEVVD